MSGLTLRLREGVTWKAFPDGVVAFVTDTCETHLLPVEFADLLLAPAKAVIINETGVEQECSIDGDVGNPLRISRNFIEEMVKLKILAFAH